MGKSRAARRARRKRKRLEQQKALEGNAAVALTGGEQQQQQQAEAILIKSHEAENEPARPEPPTSHAATTAAAAATATVVENPSGESLQVSVVSSLKGMEAGIACGEEEETSKPPPLLLDESPAGSESDETSDDLEDLDDTLDDLDDKVENLTEEEIRQLEEEVMTALAEQVRHHPSFRSLLSSLLFHWTLSLSVEAEGKVWRGEKAQEDGIGTEPVFPREKEGQGGDPTNNGGTKTSPNAADQGDPLILSRWKQKTQEEGHHRDREERDSRSDTVVMFVSLAIG